MTCVLWDIGEITAFGQRWIPETLRLTVFGKG